ncbi:MAG: DUF1629 domain-containing protein [Pseudomonadota bacterium]
MNYLIVDPINFKIKKEAKYDYDQSVDRFIFHEGKYVAKNQIDKPIIFNMKLSIKETLAFDNVINNSSCLLVNQKIIDILIKLVPEEVQFFDAEIRCKDGVLSNYKLVNITQAVKGIDHDRSMYNWIGDKADGIISLKRLVLKNDCMNGYKIARLEEFTGHTLATEDLKKAFEDARVTGLRFVTPEYYYASIYPRYAE